VAEELVRVCRLSVFGEIRGTGANNPPHRPDAAGGQTAIGELAKPDGDVHVIIDQVHRTVVQIHAHANFGIGGEKIADHRQDMPPTEHDRRRHHEVSPRRRIFTGGGAFRFGQLFEDRFRGGEKRLSRRGRRQALRGARQEVCI
jgi:hypothetical protein